MVDKLKSILLWILPLTFLAVFYFYPLASILRLSLERSELGAMAPFIEALENRSVRSVLWFTIYQAVLSTLLTIGFGIPAAFLFARYRFRGKLLIRAATSVAFVMPTLVVAAGFNALLGPRGWVNMSLMTLFDLNHPPIEFINTFSAILVAHIFYNISIVIRLVGDFWERLDPRIEQAAQVLGANRWQVWREITFPLLSPAISAAALLIFIFNFTSFGVVLMLGGPHFATLEVEIYYQTVSLFNLPLAAVLSLLQLLCTLVLMTVYTRITRQHTGHLTNRPPSSTQQPLASRPARLLAGFLIPALLILTVTPLLALASRSIIAMGSTRSPQGEVAAGFTLQFYRELTLSGQQSIFYAAPAEAVGVSVAFAAVTMVLALVLGFPAAWALSRPEGSGLNRFLDPIIILPLGTSAVTLGLGFIIALRHPPLDLRTSPFIIPIAHTLVAFPFVIRSLTPALRSIQPRLREAAFTLGASPFKTFLNVDLPLIGRALVIAAAFAFTISLGEFGATSLITRPEYPTIPVTIHRFLSRPGELNYGQAMALSTILMLVTLAGMLLVEKLRFGSVNEF